MGTLPVPCCHSVFQFVVPVALLSSWVVQHLVLTLKLSTNISATIHQIQIQTSTVLQTDKEPSLSHVLIWPIKHKISAQSLMLTTCSSTLLIVVVLVVLVVAVVSINVLKMVQLQSVPN